MTGADTPCNVSGMSEDEDRSFRPRLWLAATLGRDVTMTEFIAACGVRSSTFYEKRRFAPDFPNAEEAMSCARTFGLNPVETMVGFGVIAASEAVEAQHPTMTLTRRGVAAKSRIRADAPPL